MRRVFRTASRFCYVTTVMLAGLSTVLYLSEYSNMSAGGVSKLVEIVRRHLRARDGWPLHAARSRSMALIG